MSHGDTTHRSTDAQPESGAQEESRTDRLPVPDVARRLRGRASAGRLAGAGGGVLALRGIRRFRRGARLRGLVQTLAGVALFGVAIARRRSGGDRATAGEAGRVDQTDVVDTGPDLDGVDSSRDSGSSSHASGDEASEVVDTAPDVEGAARPPEEREEDHASGDEASEVLDTGPDIEGATTDAETATEPDETEEADQSDDEERWTEVETDAETGARTETETDAGTETETGAGTETETGAGTDVNDAGTEMMSDAAEAGTDDESAGSGAAGETFEVEAEFVERSAGDDETGAAGEDETDAGAAETDESYDRLGEAAFDGETESLPAPQRAFNQEYLALDVQAVWGIRESDDAVVVSQLYDSIDEREEMRYVASTEVDEDQMLSVPSEVLEHWDGLLEGGTAVESGDDLVFATSDDLKDDNVLLVVPEEWADDVLGEESV